MARNDPQVAAPQDLSDPLSDVAVAGPVKSPPLHLVLLFPLVGNGIDAVLGGDGFVKTGFQGGHQRDLGKRFVQLPHGCCVGRVVGRRDVGQLFHFGEQTVIDTTHPAQPAGKDRFEPDARNFRHRCQTAGIGMRKLFQTDPHGGGVIGDLPRHFFPVFADFDKTTALALTDALDSAASQLLFARQIEQPVLEAGGTEVGNKDLHGTRSVYEVLSFRLAGVRSGAAMGGFAGWTAG